MPFQLFMKASNTFQSLKDQVVRLLSLYAESAKLTVAEKLTMLLSAGVILIVTLVLGVFALAFLSGALIELLELVVVPWASYLILGGVFILFIVVLALFRKALVVNPIARFISKLVFDREKTHLEK